MLLYTGGVRRIAPVDTNTIRIPPTNHRLSGTYFKFTQGPAHVKSCVQDSYTCQRRDIINGTAYHW